MCMQDLGSLNSCGQPLFFMAVLLDECASSCVANEDILAQAQC